MSRKFDWTLLLIQPFDCRPLLPISAYSGHFAPDFAPGFAPEIDPKTLGVFAQRTSTIAGPKGASRHFVIIQGEVRPMSIEEKIDWSECPLVEIKPGVQSGAPVLRGTRMPVSAIVDNFDYGLSVAEIAEQFEISPERVEAILTYAKSHRVAHPVR
jgi:uncharacterized protein (DUF433 family)